MRAGGRCRPANPLTSSTDSSIHGGHDASDLEMDYYDYNVQNTDSVPGSYIGMDPAYCLWIPPLQQSDRSPTVGGDGRESVEMSVLDLKNDKCRRNCEISGGYDRTRDCDVTADDCWDNGRAGGGGGGNRLSADSESTLVDGSGGGDDCVSLNTLKSSPKAYFCNKGGNQKAEYNINDSSIKFVDDDDVCDSKDVSSVYALHDSNKAAYIN